MSGGAPDQGIWLGLLKWSLAHSDGTAPSLHTNMSDEDKAFLERVMRDFTRNEPERMKEIMLELVAFVDAAVASPSQAAANEERIAGLLEELQDIAEQIDMAQVFCKFGGLQCILGILEQDSLGFEVRSLSAGVLATLAQNNMQVQDMFYSQGVVPRLSVLALSSLSSEGTKPFAAKVMHSLSCTIRNHPTAEEFFSLNHGKKLFTSALPLSPPSVLSSLTSLSVPNTFSAATLACMRRAVHLADALLASDTRSAPRLALLLPAVVPAVFQCLALPDLDLREGTSRLLLTVMSIAKGHATLTAAGPVRDAFLSTLARRKTMTLADDEQEVHERAMVEQLEALAEGPFTSVGHVERSAADRGPDDDDEGGVEGEASAPRLLLGAP